MVRQVVRLRRCIDVGTVHVLEDVGDCRVSRWVKHRLSQVGIASGRADQPPCPVRLQGDHSHAAVAAIAALMPTVDAEADVSEVVAGVNSSQ